MLREHVLVAGDGLGPAVDGVGDIDGDGVPDLALGVSVTPSAAAPTKRGLVAVRSGADGRLLWRIVDGAGTGIGAWLRGGADLDGDGTPDLVCAGRQHEADAFEVQARSGADGALLHAFRGELPLALDTPACVDVLQDLDGDGCAEIVVPQGEAGVSVISGRTGALLRQAVLGHGRPAARMPHAGYLAVFALGDVDGDGRPDLALGHPINPPFVTVLSSTGELVGHVKCADWSGSYGYGISLAALDDVDHDGLADFAIGTGSWWAPQAPGYVELVSGRTGVVLRTLRLAELQSPRQE